jgi:hypothetical protein
MWQDFTDWFHSPFDPNNFSVIDLFLVTGIVIIAAIFWAMIIGNFQRELS